MVSEGTSDFPVLREIVTALLPAAELVPWHPERPAAGQGPSVAGETAIGPGWRGVKAWCEENGDDLEILLRAVIGDEFDGLILHVDAAIADKLGIEAGCPPASATTDQLRSAILEDWLGLAAAPAYLVLATPCMETEAWILAAVGANDPDLECKRNVSEMLMKRLKHKLRLQTRAGRIRKSLSQYELLAKTVGPNLSQVRSVCSEADRFAGDVLHLAAAVAERRPSPSVG